MYKKAKASAIVILLLSLMYVAPIPMTFAAVTVFEDNFNIISESSPKWTNCGFTPTYDTVNFFEANASVTVRDGGGAEGSTNPIYHTITNLNTTNGAYNYTVWLRSAQDHTLTSLDIDGSPCNFSAITWIGARAFISAVNVSYQHTPDPWAVSNIVLAGWYQVTQLLTEFNDTHNTIAGLVNGTQIFSFLHVKFSTVTLLLHDARGTDGVTTAWYDLLEFTQEGDDAPIQVSINSGTIINLEPCGDWVYAEDKFYNYTIGLGGGSVAHNVWLQLSDGVNNMTMLYNITLETQQLIVGEDVINLGLITSSLDTDTNVLSVHFPIFFRNTIIDIQNANITARATDINGIDTGWVIVQQDFYQIYNKGGFSQTVISGTAGRVSGGDTFELFAQNNSWVFANQTFRKIQQFSTQFGLRFSSPAGVGEDQFMQDFGHSASGVETSSAKGDWQLTIAMNYCDEAADVMVRGFYVILQMENGDVGVDDQWININATWYNKDDTFIRSEIFNAWIELEPLAQHRLWLDLWYNKQNSSTLGGGRTSAYYFGMHKSTFMIFGGDWSPQIINATESLAFIDLLDNSSSLISSPQLDLMSISYNLTRLTTQNSTDWRLTLRDYDVLEYKLRDNKKQMEGINTPTPNKPKVPDMPVTGFLAPLYAAVASIGIFVVNGLTGVAGIAWDWIGAQFPWFTGFIDSITAALGSLFIVFEQLFSGLLDLFAFTAERISLLAVPFQLIGDSWDVLVVNTAIFFQVDPASVTLLIVIIAGVLPFVEALSRGDSSFIIRALSLAWGVANTMIGFFVRFGRMVVQIALEFWPF